jgi:hypothetical protein
MSPTRATAYVGLALVLVAWLAGAAGIAVTSPSPQPQPGHVGVSATQALADEVQAQASRLRARMARAPAPRTPVRNPFAFAKRTATPAQEPPGVLPKPLGPAQSGPGEPPLQLVGIAERETPAGVVRTALITADSDELFMMVEGDTLGGRYRVKTVFPDGVELTDLTTSMARRLSLQ